MVRKCITLVLTALCISISAEAQNFSVDDTVTEYPHKGTYYHNKFEGRKTANGEIFDQNLFTAAHWKIKLGTYVLVTNQNTGLQVIVRVNDRCPKRGVFDMSHRAANSIGIKGMQPVRIRILPDGYEERWAAQDAMFDSVYSKFRTGEANKQQEPQKTSKTTHNQTHRKDNKAAKLPSLPPASTSANERYNVALGEVASHSEVFEIIRRLPQAYQEKALLDSVDSGGISVMLELNLTKEKAQELQRTLKTSFPDCRIVPSR